MARGTSLCSCTAWPGADVRGGGGLVCSPAVVGLRGPRTPRCCRTRCRSDGLGWGKRTCGLSPVWGGGGGALSARRRGPTWGRGPCRANGIVPPPFPRTMQVLGASTRTRPFFGMIFQRLRPPSDDLQRGGRRDGDRAPLRRASERIARAVALPVAHRFVGRFPPPKRNAHPPKLRALRLLSFCQSAGLAGGGGGGGSNSFADPGGPLP